MRTRINSYALSISVTAGLAGCGVSQPSIGAPGSMPMQPQLRFGLTAAPSLRRTVPSPGYKATAPLLYATNVGNTNVTVYQARAKDPGPLVTITDGLTNPFGACIDGHGTLYITNEPASGGWVSEYTLGKTKASRIITQGISGPAYCAIDAKGNLWVANAYGSNVTEYLYGEKKPHTVITKGLWNLLGWQSTVPVISMLGTDLSLHSKTWRCMRPEADHRREL